MTAVQEKKKRCEEERWRFVFKGHEYVLCDVADKVYTWLDRFKQIGDIAVNVDPLHAGLPWAGIRVLVQVRQCSIFMVLEYELLGNQVLTPMQIAISGKEQMGALLLGLNKVLYLLDRCTIYEILYTYNSQPKDAGEALALKNLTSALIELYAIILLFLAKANGFFGKSTAHRSLSAFLSPTDVVDLEKKCHSSEERVEREAGNCERYCRYQAQSQEFQNLTKLLQGLEDQNKLLSGLKGAIDTISSRAKNDDQNKILSWVSKIQFKKIHESARDGRTVDTGAWLLEHNKFKRWSLSDKSEILWLHGIRKYLLISLFY